LSYTTFSLSNLRLNSHTMRSTGSVTVTVDVKNAGSRHGDEVVQLYIHDPVASISQPVRRLRDFQRVTLDPGQAKSVKVTLDRNGVGFYDGHDGHSHRGRQLRRQHWHAPLPHRLEPRERRRAVQARRATLCAEDRLKNLSGILTVFLD
jgi:hypothetical protein